MHKTIAFSNFFCMFLNPNIFSSLNYNCSKLLDKGNLQVQVKKAFCYQKLFWPFNVWINCSSDRKKIANSRPSASNFKKKSRSFEQFFLTLGLNNFGNKIPFLHGTFEAEGQEFSKILRSLEQFVQTLKGQNNFW